MTEEEKRKMREGFVKQEPEEATADYWTDDRLIEAAKRIIKRLGIKGEL